MYKLWINSVRVVDILCGLYTSIFNIGGWLCRNIVFHTAYKIFLPLFSHKQKPFSNLFIIFIHPFHNPYNLNNYIN